MPMYVIIYNPKSVLSSVCDCIVNNSYLCACVSFKYYMGIYRHDVCTPEENQLDDDVRANRGVQFNINSVSVIDSNILPICYYDIDDTRRRGFRSSVRTYGKKTARAAHARGYRKTFK